MEIYWLGTASAEIFCGGAHILVDPYFQKSFKARKGQYPALEKAIGRADAILITHPHMDHFSDIRRVARLTGAPIYVSPQGVKLAGKRGVGAEAFREIHGGMTFNIGGAQVRVWPSRHVQFDEALVKRTKKRAYLPHNYPRGLRIWELTKAFPITDEDVFAFEISCEGKMIFILGSANLREGVDYPTGADALLFPYQGRSDLDEYSVPMIERLEPKTIVLTHFDDAFPPISERIDTGRFRERFPNALEPGFNEKVVV